MRWRQYSTGIGQWEIGPHNAITDVAGVQVGHASWSVDNPQVQRTGVTVILLRSDIYRHPVYASADVLNGFGELTGRSTIEEWGLLATPIVLTNTRSVGAAYEAVMRHFLESSAQNADASLPLPVVGECDDSFLNDNRAATPPHIFDTAFDALSDGAVAEGAVGAGTGMHLFGYKGGIGTASRIVPTEVGVFRIGVLLNGNFGRPHQIRLPVGVEPSHPPEDVPRDGSCIGVVATDAPLWPHELKRLARRVGLGLSRAGSVGNDTSGEIFVACSTASPTAYSRITEETRQLTGLTEAPMNHLFEAVADAAEESVWNALLEAKTTVGVDGHVLRGFLG